ncbi:MAG: hypothetical protein IPK04_05330 [Bdellovibrionales bacterium]|nr:hypothetical protein [Bdellovibrionales bacterium]
MTENKDFMPSPEVSSLLSKFPILQLFVWSLCDEPIKEEMISFRAIIGKRPSEREARLKTIDRIYKKFLKLAEIQSVLTPFEIKKETNWNSVSSSFEKTLARAYADIDAVMKGSWPSPEQAKLIHSKGKPKPYANWCIHHLVNGWVSGGASQSRAKRNVANLFEQFDIQINIDVYLGRYKDNPLQPKHPDDFFLHIKLLKTLLES